jgi:hypothetical protein
MRTALALLIDAGFLHADYRALTARAMMKCRCSALSSNTSLIISSYSLRNLASLSGSVRNAGDQLRERAYSLLLRNAGVLWAQARDDHDVALEKQVGHGAAETLERMMLGSPHDAGDAGCSAPAVGGGA